LSWDESVAADFDYFSVYGSNNDSFAAATLIDHTAMPALDVTASPHAYYFVTAADISGNEGSASALGPLTGGGDTAARYTLDISAYPNPFNPSTMIRYTLPSKGHVTIAVYDARGALVTTLVDEERSAGAHVVAWGGRDERGATASSGVYFVKITNGNDTQTRKIALVK